MPYHYFHEIWTPLKLMGFQLFRDEQGNLWYKVLSGRRKMLRKSSKIDEKGVS
ncbi:MULTISPECIES: hypothetical protein [Cohnella]|uniref:hypothetical protein n=1 Tax=Cohnella TaxID=329857 RepID=UPI001594D579|nr:MULTISPECIES: hypothetical protein [Cohnella]MBN2980978.1 hypothetical protein [Cohnella algarum]